MAKNPLLEKKYQEGLLRGIEIGKALGKAEGIEIGKVEGRDLTINWFEKRFEGLDKVPGIGPKITEKFVNHFGPEHFKKVEG